MVPVQDLVLPPKGKTVIGLRSLDNRNFWEESSERQNLEEIEWKQHRAYPADDLLLLVKLVGWHLLHCGR